MAQNNELDEFEELVLYVRSFKHSVNNKFDEHFYIMQQQHLRIEEQNRVIDELAWQIRDLRDQVRRVNANNKLSDNNNHNKNNENKCVCNYENHISVARQQRSNNKFGRFLVEAVHETNTETVYEPIEYNNKVKVQNAPTPAPRTSPITKPNNNLNVDRAELAITPNYGQVNKLKRQPKGEIFNEEELLPRWSFLDEELKRCTLNEEQCINSTGPNKNDVSSTDDDDIDEFVILRNMHKKNYNFNTKRGSSKALTSLLSNIEEDYIPEANKLTNSNIVQLPDDNDDDDDEDDDDNISKDNTNILKAKKYLKLLRRPTTVTGLTPTINQNNKKEINNNKNSTNSDTTTDSVQIRPSFNAANKRMGISMR